uniref:Eukaryotic translation initiation factor 4E transporter isoform X1 n=1 Tax=Geotrypetes seraphini TaxID=260995 RepID=A0A6P8S032_GEOSA|nr:eukaryotic translation initiation factor 4E transporter isoform X1 [Geotrypetes seraphini]
MERKGTADASKDQNSLCRRTPIVPRRYSKEELLDIKEHPHCKHRPPCLSDKYDSDGVWDPEKWHASLYPTSGQNSPIEGLKKDLDSDRASLKRRIADPKERVKEDDLDVVLSPQRRSFGGGCHVTTAVGSRSAGSPLENKENENVRGVGRRIGSGRIISARGFERDARGGEKDSRDHRDRERERDYKDKRFRREYGDNKRVFSERRHNDSYTEEEPEWFSAGPTSQSETIELTGFDDKILEEDEKGRKRTRRRTTSLKEGFECNGGIAEADIDLPHETTADQEVPQDMVLPQPTPGEFDFNEFFNLDKSVPGLASMIEDVLGEGSVSASRFSRWFSNPSRSGSHCSSLRSTPHEELEKLAGLEQLIPSPAQNASNYFAPIQLEDGPENKVDILEMLQKAKVDLKPLLSSLTANKEKLRESTHTGVVLSVEEVEAGLKGLKVEQEGKIATPFMVDQLEENFTVIDTRLPKKDGDMSAFNKLVSSMKASGTLPCQPKASQNLENHLPSPDEPGSSIQKNILQELLGPPLTKTSSSNVLSGLMGALDPATSLRSQKTPPPPTSQVFPARASSADYLRPRISSPIGFAPGPQLLRDHIAGMQKQRPVPSQVSPFEVQQAALDGLLLSHELPIQAANFYQPDAGSIPLERGRDGYLNRPQLPQRLNKSPGATHRASAASPSHAASITSMLSPSFTPTSVIRKMYESKEKSKPAMNQSKEEGQRENDDGFLVFSMGENADRDSSPTVRTKFLSSQRSGCSTPLSQQNRYTKEQDYRTKTVGRKTPTIASPVPGAPFLQPVHQVPLLPHVPLVRPHQLHPGLVQRMLAQGLHPQHLPPLLQAGMLPPGLDLSHMQGMSPSILYPLPSRGHPLLNARPGNPLQLAVMQQHAQRSASGTQGLINIPPRAGLQLEHLPGQRSTSPVGLAKWFGSDVLQQPLPSMPAKVISVDELEFQQ